MSDIPEGDIHYGNLFDPGSPIPRPVVLQLQSKTLVIKRPKSDQIIDRWEYEDLRLVDEGEAYLEVTHVDQPLERLEILDPIVHAELLRRSPRLSKYYVLQQTILKVTGGLVGGAIALAAIAYVAMLVAAPALTEKLPWDWHQKWGADVYDTAFGGLRRCRSAQADAVLKALTNQMVRAGDVPFPIDTRVVDVDYVNIVGLPGGRLVIFRGLLDQLENSAELAGFMALAVGHMQKMSLAKALLDAEGVLLITDGVLGTEDARGEVLQPIVADHNFSLPEMKAAIGFVEQVLVDLGIDVGAHARALRRFQRAEDEEMQSLLAHMLSTYPKTIEQSNWGRDGHPGSGGQAMTPGAWAMLKNICAQAEQGV